MSNLPPELITPEDIPDGFSSAKTELGVNASRSWLLEQSNAGLETLGLEAQDVSAAPCVIDLNSYVMPMESGQSPLLGVIDAGGTAVKIYAGTDEHGTIDPRNIILTADKYDPDTVAELDKVQRRQWVFLSQSDNKTVFGRNAPSSSALDLEDMHVSGQHFGIEFKDNKIVINDEDSTNGTRLIAVRGTARKSTEVDNLKYTPEFQLGGVTYTFEGVAGKYENKNRIVFNSVDENGIKRRFVIYRSQSEGSLRSSQGWGRDNEGKVWVMKGGETGQYTQDTQLHPDFAKEALQAMGDPKLAKQADISDLDFSTAAEQQRVEKDFDTLVKTFAFPGKRAGEVLWKIHAGETSIDAVSRHLKVPEAKAPSALAAHVQEMNSAIEKDKLVPDFTEPIAVEYDTHPLLGTYTREVFRHSVKGSNYEWHVSHDVAGRVWIERIRYADAEPSAYGTDNKLVFSGLLTTKPLEYIEQATAIDSNEQVGGYKDISKFLDTFSPIKKYRQQRQVQRR